MITLTTYDEAREAFRCRDLRQALYDAGHQLMTGVIVNLHGDEHVARRRLENRLFRRDTFAWYERARIPQIVEAVLADPVAVGRGDLPSIARRTMMTLSVDVAGVDLPSGTGGEDAFDPEVFEGFYDLMNRLARASTVAHAIGDADAIKADGNAALDAFRTEFFDASLRRREELVARHRAGEIDRDDLPRDVLTTLLLNQDSLDLPAEYVLREIAYYPWVGSHSTSGQLVHAMHHIFEWLEAHPNDRARLERDDELRQRFVHESMRLHPASPVAMREAVCDIEMKSGRVIEEGTIVAISVEQANRDPDYFGDNPAVFDPDRKLAESVAPWGLSFGHGAHACLGQELAGGLAAEDEIDHHLLGSVALMAGSLLRHGARPDPNDPPTLDDRTTRFMWGRYPVVLERSP